MINGIDYNNKQGRHPRNCDCIKHQTVVPVFSQPIVKGINNVANNNPIQIDPAMLQQLQALLNPSANAITQTPTNPVVQVTPNIPMQTEYVIPLTPAVAKNNGFATMGDARGLAKTFDLNADDVRITKVYVNPAILGNGQFELVLRRK